MNFIIISINLLILLIVVGEGLSGERSGGKSDYGKKLRDSYGQMKGKARSLGQQLTAKINSKDNKGSSGNSLGNALEGARAKANTITAKLGRSGKGLVDNGGRGSRRGKERPDGDSGAMADIDSTLQSKLDEIGDGEPVLDELREDKEEKRGYERPEDDSGAMAELDSILMSSAPDAKNKLKKFLANTKSKAGANARALRAKFGKKKGVKGSKRGSGGVDAATAPPTGDDEGDQKLKSGNPFDSDDDDSEGPKKNKIKNFSTKGLVESMIAEDMDNSGTKGGPKIGRRRGASGGGEGDDEYDSRGRRRSHHDKVRESKGLGFRMDQDDDDYSSGYGRGGYGRKGRRSRSGQPRYDTLEEDNDDSAVPDLNIPPIGYRSNRRGRNNYDDHNEDPRDYPRSGNRRRSRNDRGIKSFSTLEQDNDDNALAELKLVPVEFSSKALKDFDDELKDDQEKPSPASSAFDREDYQKFRQNRGSNRREKSYKKSRGGRRRGRDIYQDDEPYGGYSRQMKPRRQSDRERRSRPGKRRDGLRPLDDHDDYPKSKSSRRSRYDRADDDEVPDLPGSIKQFSTLEQDNDDNAVPDLPLEPVSYRSNFAKDLFTIVKPDAQGEEKEDKESENPDKSEQTNKDDKPENGEDSDNKEGKNNEKDEKDGQHKDDAKKDDNHKDDLDDHKKEKTEEKEKKPVKDSLTDNKKKLGIKSYSSLGDGGSGGGLGRGGRHRGRYGKENDDDYGRGARYGSRRRPQGRRSYLGDDYDDDEGYGGRHRSGHNRRISRGRDYNSDYD